MSRNALTLIDADGRRAARLGALFERAGWQVESAPSALSVLSAIEWACPDLLLVQADLVGISALELCTTIQHDPALDGVRLVLYASRAVDEPERCAFDQVIVSDELAEIAATVGRPVSRAWPRRDRGHRMPAARLDGLARVVGGLGLGDVVEALTDSALTGRLTVSLRGAPSALAIFFDQGKAIHPEGSDHVDLDTLRELCCNSPRGDVLWYQFDKIPLPAADHSLGRSEPSDHAAVTARGPAGGDYETHEIDPAVIAELRRP